MATAPLPRTVARLHAPALRGSRDGVARLTDGATFEVDNASMLMSEPIVIRTIKGKKLVCTPSAGGTTVTELIGETIRQGAELDGQVGVHLLAELAPQMMRSAIAIGRDAADVALVGFDGDVLWRQSRGPRRSSTLHALAQLTVQVLAGQRLATVTSSEPDVSFPNLDAPFREPARAFVRSLFEQTKLASASAGDASDPVPPAIIARVLDELTQLRSIAAPLCARDVGGIVSNLHPERAEREKRARDLIEAAMTSYRPAV